MDDFLHIFEKMDGSTSYKTGDTANSNAPAPALDLSFVTAVALDATDSGRDDHVAYLGVKDYDSGDANKPNYDKELRLVLYNARTNTTVAMLSLGDVSSWIGSVEQWAYKTFISVTAGDYDGDGVDEIACTDANMGVQMVEIGVGEGSSLTLTKGRRYSWSELVPASVVNDMKIAESEAERRALISLATGNLDGTGAEELAVAISTNHPGSSNLPTVPAAYSTQLAAVRFPMSNEATICPTSIRTTSKNIEDEELQEDVIHTVLYAGQITAGDVNGDRKDEIVVGGYTGKIKVDSDKDLSGRYELYGDYDDGDGNIEYTVALCYATLNGNALGHSEITIDAMTPFIKEGFFDYHGAGANDFLVPLSLATAKLHGPYSKESVFAGGKIYQLTTVEDANGIAMEEFGALYTHEFFNEESSAGYTDAYVEHVTSGIFAGPDPLDANNEMVNEQFVFAVVEKENSYNDYYYKIGFVGMSTDSDGTGTFYDNTTTMNDDGHLLSNRDGGVEENYGTALVPVAVDVDDDGLLVKYVGATYYYEDPSVEAVLQAAPYFDELGGWTDEFSGSTTYSVTVSRSLIDIWGHSISVHAGVKGKAGSDLTGELEIKVGYALDVDMQHEKTYTTAYTTTFVAGPYDTVVVQRTPYVCYEYARVDESGNVLPETDEARGGSVFFMEAMHPVYVQLSVDEYNQFVDEYNAMADEHDQEGSTLEGSDNYRLVKITEDILPANATGNPANYYSSLYGGQYISQGTYALGYNGGSTVSEFSESVEKSFAQVNAHGAHIEVEGVAPTPLGFSLGAFAETSFQDTAGWGDATLNESATGGEVANINPSNYSAAEQQTLRQYGFNWRCAMWKKSLMTNADGTPFLDANGAEIQVPIVGYVVTNVKSPMAAPTGVDAYLSGRGNQVTVEWNRSPDADGALKGYSIYRYCDYQDPVLVNETYLAPDVTSFVDTTKLRAGKIYNYYVTAFYSTGTTSYKTMSSKTSAVVWGIPLFWLEEEEGGGDPDTPEGPGSPDSPGSSITADQVEVTNVRFVVEDGVPYLRWDAPANALEGLTYSVFFCYAAEDETGRRGFANVQDFRIDLNRLSAEEYTEIQIVSLLDGKEVCVVSSRDIGLNLTIAKNDFEAKLAIKDNAVGDDIFMFSDLPANSWFHFEAVYGNSSSNSSYMSGANGACHRTDDAKFMEEFAYGSYRILEQPVVTVSDDAKSLSITQRTTKWRDIQAAVTVPAAVATSGMSAELTEKLGENAAMVSAALSKLTVDLVTENVEIDHNGWKGEDDQDFEIPEANENTEVTTAISLEIAVVDYIVPEEDEETGEIVGDKTLVLDITPFAVTTVTTVTKDEAGNEHKTTQTAATGVNTVGIPVVVTIPLPDGFANCGDVMYVVHEKGDSSGTRFTHRVEVQEDDNGNLYVTFVNTNGFSMFTVTDAVAVLTYVADGETRSEKVSTVQAALSKAKSRVEEAYSDVTVTILWDDLSEEYLVVPAGVTLNLNGNTISVSALTAFGEIVDTENFGGKGKICVSKTDAFFSEIGTYLPIYDSEGAYRFFRYELRSKAPAYDGGDKVTYQTYPRFSNKEAYYYLQGEDHGVSFGAVFAWTGSVSESYQAFMPAETLCYFSNVLQNQSGYSFFKLTIRGVSALNGSDLKLHTVMKIDQGVKEIVGGQFAVSTNS